MAPVRMGGATPAELDELGATEDSEAGVGPLPMVELGVLLGSLAGQGEIPSQ